MQFAVVGHVEWVDFLRVERVPRTGEIAHAVESWSEAAGGGADAAVQLLKLAGAATLFTALGDDVYGRRSYDELMARGVTVQAVWRPDPQRRAVCFLDDAGERSITLFSPKLVAHRADPLPWDALSTAAGVYFSGGDAGAVRAARSARVLVATARELSTLRDAGVELDVLVASAADEGERYEVGQLEPAPRFVVRTEGANGGTVEPGGRFAAVAPSGPVVDTYGAGDAFAAGLTYALGTGSGMPSALTFAARCGAAALTGRGPYSGQLSL